jgi:hypothetical protein
MGKRKAEAVKGVWTLVTREEKEADESLELIVESALAGERKAVYYLKSLWDNEKWADIRRKLLTKGSAWLAFWMDGVRVHLENLKKSKVQA